MESINGAAACSTDEIRFMSELQASYVFETMRAYNGKVFCLRGHLQRLMASANALNMKALEPGTAETAVKKELNRSKLKDAHLRISYNGRSLRVMARPVPLYPREHYNKGVSVITVPTLRNAPHATDGKIKCGDFLWGVMAKMESRGAFEAVLLNKDGYVTEATVSNIFIVRPATHSLPANLAGRDTRRFCILTAPSCLGVLNGITRRAVIDIARKIKFSVKEEPFTRYSLYTAEECFLTNTSMEIMPVVNADGRIVGSGKPGRIASVLLREFRKLAAA